jgi:hypothetical protein
MNIIRLGWIAASLSLAAIACAEEIDPVDPPTYPDDPTGSAKGSSSASSSSAADAGRPTDVLQQNDAGWAIPSPASSDAGSSPLCTINELAEPNDTKVQPLASPTTCGSIGGGGGTDAVDQYELSTTTTTKKTITFKATGDATLVFSAFGFSQSIKSGESIDIPSFGGFGGMALKVRLTVQSPTNKPQSYRID